MNKKISENNIRTWKDIEVRKRRIDGILNRAYKGQTPKSFYIEKIKPLLYKGISASAVSKICGMSPPTTRKLVNLYGSNQDRQKAFENCKINRTMGGRSNKGRQSPLKDKTYEQILGSKELARKRAEITSKWMKVNNIRKYATKISKPQRMLYEIVKSYYPNVILEYEVKIEDKRSIWLDVAVPDIKINFEYDGIYWHDLNNKKSVVKSKFNDIQRDQYLKNNGWKILRFCYKKNPTYKVLEEAVKIKIKRI